MIQYHIARRRSLIFAADSHLARFALSICLVGLFLSNAARADNNVKSSIVVNNYTSHDVDITLDGGYPCRATSQGQCVYTNNCADELPSAHEICVQVPLSLSAHTVAFKSNGQTFSSTANLKYSAPVGDPQEDPTALPAEYRAFCTIGNDRYAIPKCY